MIQFCEINAAFKFRKKDNEKIHICISLHSVVDI